jgi:molybdate transport system regulatory protein
MPIQEKRRPSCKIWIEHQNKPILGKGGAQILEQIAKEENLSRAAKRLGMSYRYVWNYLKKMEKIVGEPIVETYKGGKSGGGGGRLTELGRDLLDEYSRLEGFLNEVISSVEFAEAIGLKISARNRFKGKVVSVEKDGVTAKVKVEVRMPVIVTALISEEAVEDLNIRVGDEVEAIVKATEVMIAK